MKNRDVIIACDFDSKEKLYDFLKPFDERKIFPFLKIGMELFYSENSDFLSDYKMVMRNIFLDLKLHDIPTTVGKTVKVLSKLPIDILSVHENRSLSEAVKNSYGIPGVSNSINIAAVSFLTSEREPEIEDKARKFESIEHAGCKYVICPAYMVKSAKLCGLKTICPGIRLEKDSIHDQKLIATPAQAKEWGADYIVVGRSITQAEDPVETYLQICKDFL